MGRVIVVQYITLDGVVEDPDGSDGTPFGGWAMHYGPEGVAGDKFELGDIMATGVLLFGRRTWDHFATLWPPRETPFARAMNDAEKAVVTSRPLPPGVWANSHRIEQPLPEWVGEVARTRDVVVIGSHAVIRALQAHDLVDEYRLITFPAALGEGRRLFPDGAQLRARVVRGEGAGMPRGIRHAERLRTLTREAVGRRWFHVRMDATTSADGTTLAFESSGDGPAVVIINGAMSTAADAAPLAAALVDAGYRAVTWDRRARGSSGDAPGSTPEREVEDLAAVIDAAGGEAAVLGHSSGAVLALYAASLGVPVRALFLSEPPFRFGDDEPATDLAERLQDLVDHGLHEDAVATFQIEGVGLPREMVEGMRAGGQLAGLAPLAQSVVYDTLLTRQVSTPTAEMLAVAQPVTILRGEQTFPILLTAADRLAAAMPAAELVVVPESVMHRADPAATARVLRERLG